MLDALRQASQNWIGRSLMAVVMGFIVLSFVVWGIGDIFRGFGDTSLARVGGTSISTDAFRTTYQQQLQRLQQQQRRPITAEQARAMGLDGQVMGKLVADAVLDDRARSLGLAMSDKDIVKSALDDPAFKGPSGAFDQNVFQQLLRDNGMTEAMFVRDQRGVYLRREIADALVGSLKVPQVAMEAINRFRNETRSIDYFTLGAAAAGDVPAPSDADLHKFYDDRKQAWNAPAYRKLVVLAISPETLADPKSVSDADAKARYESTKSRYGTPETREIQQVLFATEADAKAASDKVKAGANLDGVATDAKLQVVDLGEVKRSDLFDKPVGDAAFALSEGAVSDPVKSQFGYMLVRTAKIVPAAVKPYEEVAESIKADMAVERAHKTAEGLRDKVEDQRASGRPLVEAAKSAGVQVQDVAAVDAQGRDKAGAPVVLPERDALLKAAFASDIGVDNDVISTRGGGFVWYEVAGIEPARQRGFDEVKAQVESAWRDDEVAKRLSAKAADLVKQLASGGDVEAIAAANGGATVEHANDVKRIGTTSVPPALVNAVFNVQVGAGGSAAGDGQTRTVFKVLDSVVPPYDPDGDVMKAVNGELRQQFTEDILTEYLTQMQQTLGVTVNQAAMRSVSGGAGGDALN